MKGKFEVSKERRNAIQKFLSENPDGTYGQFLKTSKVKISGTGFYKHKHAIEGHAVPKPFGQSVYQTIAVIEKESIKCDSEVISKLVETLNGSLGVKLQVVELQHPEAIEIRRVQK